MHKEAPPSTSHRRSWWNWFSRKVFAYSRGRKKPRKKYLLAQPCVETYNVDLIMRQDAPFEVYVFWGGPRRPPPLHVSPYMVDGFHDPRAGRGILNFDYILQVFNLDVSNYSFMES